MNEPRIFLVAGLGWGDEGKGSLVDFLAHQYDTKLVVRYNGGPQAAHNVVTPEGVHHTFASFGSGTFKKECQTYLSRFMLVEPYAILNEANDLSRKITGESQILGRLVIDGNCPIITPFHWKTNRIKELARREMKHGSCGFGIGELRSDMTSDKTVIYARDLAFPSVVREKLAEIKLDKLTEAAPNIGLYQDSDVIYRTMASEKIPCIANDYYEFSQLVKITTDFHKTTRPWGSRSIIFEGAQGVLLDENYGFAPYNSWTDCTFKNAHTLLAEMDQAYKFDVTKVGVLRPYSTRHGTGPFPSEYDGTMHSKRPTLIGEHNKWNTWQEGLRIGWFDPLMTRYAIKALGGVDNLCINRLDDLHDRSDFEYVSRYFLRDYETRQDTFFDEVKEGISARELSNYRAEIKTFNHNVGAIRAIEELLNKPIAFFGKGPTRNDKGYVI